MSSLVKRAAPRHPSAPKPHPFASHDDRLRLTATALDAMRSLSKTWGLTGDETAALLGVSASTWDRMRAGTWTQALSQDQFTRVSAIVGIYKALHLLFADALADRWPRLANSGPMFENRTPIDAMIDGGIPVMIDIRRYVDALRGGL